MKFGRNWCRNGQKSGLLSAPRAALRDIILWISIVDFGYEWDFIYLRTVVQFTRCDVHNRGKFYTYVQVQQSLSANSIVAACSQAYVVDHPELCT